MKSELMQRLTEELAGEVLNYQHVPSFGERDVLRAAGWRFPSGNAVGNNAYREARSGELIEVKFCFQMEKESSLQPAIPRDSCCPTQVTNSRARALENTGESI
jgi:hypothetical protein